MLEARCLTPVRLETPTGPGVEKILSRCSRGSQASWSANSHAEEALNLGFRVYNYLLRQSVLVVRRTPPVPGLTWVLPQPWLSGDLPPSRARV